MGDPHGSSEDIDDVARRIRQAVELQNIIQGGALFPPFVGRSNPAPARRTVEAPPVPAAPPAPAALVTDARELPGPAPAAHVLESWQGDPSDSSTVGELHDNYSACRRCSLGQTRTNFVFGVGDPNANVMFVGEAPGRDEDMQGEPFVGRAGQLLNKILEAIGFQREEVYIANILKCRPPGNRDPQPTEIASCEPILARQIELIRPLVLCTLGSFAVKTLLGVTTGITRLRGQIHQYRGVPLIPTYHPAALLRNPAWKRPVWEDVQLLRREHDRLLAESETR